MQHENEFPFIVKWHRRTGSFDYYIQNLLNAAFEDKAPSNAVFKRGNEWSTTDDIKNDDLISLWNLPNKPDKSKLTGLLNRSVLKGEAYGIMEELINKCSSFKDFNWIKGVIDVFINP